MTRTRAAILEAKGAPLSVREVSLSAPKEREVLVKMEMAGLCRSDLNAIVGHTRYDMPLVLGHEGAGTVVETGAGVKSLKKGDRVVLSWAAFCGDCFFCNKGLTHQCHTVAWPRGKGFLPDWTTRFSENGKEIFHFNGVSSFSEYTIVYETGCVKVDDGIPFELASVVGCSVVTGIGAVYNTANVEEGSTALVVGGGNVGMSVIQALKIKGAGFIIAVDPKEEKWTAVKEAGADIVLPEISIDEIRKATGGFGVDYAFDGVATEETLNKSLAAVRRAGTVVMVGSPHPLAKYALPPIEFHLEKKIIGSLYGSSNPVRDIPRLLEFYKQGRLKLDGFTTGSFRLDDINSAVKELENGGGKYTITFD